MSPLVFGRFVLRLPLTAADRHQENQGDQAYAVKQVEWVPALRFEHSAIS